jgi:hypothetical protein
MRITLTCVLASTLAAPFAWGQKLELKLDHLKAKATESTEVDLDGAALDLALKLAKPGEAPKRVEVKGVYVRSFEFSKPGQYSEDDVESVLKQVRGNSAWTRLLSVRDKEDHVEIHLMNKGDQVGGLVILAAEPEELTVVNIVGSATLDRVKELVTSDLHYDLKHLAAMAGKH